MSVRRYRPRTLLLELTMVLVGVAFVFPVYILINLSLKRPNDQSSPLSLATHPTLSNYGDAWHKAGLGGALANTFIVTALSVALIVVLSSLAAYPLARVARAWSKAVFGLFIVGLLLPFQLALIPLYTTIRDLHLLGTLWSLVIFYVGLQMPFSIFLYVAFLRALPRDYEEAAAIDGCTPLRGFVTVVFPLLRPITGTVAILNAIFVWNDFLTPLLYLSGSSHQTVTVALFGFVGQFVSEWNLVFAGLVISIAPLLLAYFLMQRSIIRGFAGGLKG
jgi:raffinose/stachyose/melibiose transport system permease protein